MARFDLTDLEWSVIEPRLPTDVREKEWVDDRRVLNKRDRVDGAARSRVVTSVSGCASRRCATMAADTFRLTELSPSMLESTWRSFMSLPLRCRLRADFGSSPPVPVWRHMPSDDQDAAPASVTGLAVDVRGRCFGERVGFLDRDVDLLSRKEIDCLGERLRHSPASVLGETDAEVRRTEIGDGDHLLRIPGQADEFADHAGAGEVESRVDVGRAA